MVFKGRLIQQGSIQQILVANLLCGRHHCRPGGSIDASLRLSWMGVKNGAGQVKPANTALLWIPITFSISHYPWRPSASDVFQGSASWTYKQLLILSVSDLSSRIRCGIPEKEVFHSLTPHHAITQTLLTPSSGSSSSQEATESRSCHHSFRLQHYPGVKRKLGTLC